MKLKVKAIRANLNMSQKEFADILGMSLSTYQKKEQGISPWLFEEIVMIANKFNIDINQIDA